MNSSTDIMKSLTHNFRRLKLEKLLQISWVIYSCSQSTPIIVFATDYLNYGKSPESAVVEWINELTGIRSTP